VKFTLNKALIGAGLAAVLAACGDGAGDGAWRGDVSYEPPGPGGGRQVDCPLTDTPTGLTLKICNLPANTVLHVAHARPSEIVTNTASVRGSGEATTNLPLGALQAGDTLQLAEIRVDAPQRYLVTCTFSSPGDYATLREDGSLQLTTNVESAAQTVLCGRTYLLAQWRKYERIPTTTPIKYVQETGYLRINVDTATGAWLKDSQGGTLHAGDSLNVGGIPFAYANGRVLLPIYESESSSTASVPQLGVVVTNGLAADTHPLMIKQPNNTEQAIVGTNRNAILWNSRTPSEAFSLGNPEKFYFTTSQLENGVRTYYDWQTDGTSAGTQAGGMLATLYSQYVGVNGSRPTVTQQGDALYIQTVSSVLPNGRVATYAIHRMDILSGETTELLSATRNFTFVAEIGNKVMFRTGGLGSPPSDRELSVIDLADKSITTLVTRSGRGTFTFRATLFNGEVYFTMTGSLHELWKTDGTLAGTQLVKDFKQETGYATPAIHRMTATSKLMFLSVLMNRGNGVTTQGLWKSDGTTEGTQLVDDPSTLMPNPNTGNNTSLGNLYAVGDRVVFRDDGKGGIRVSHLWSSDGTAEGTVRLFPDAEVSAVHAANQCPIDCRLSASVIGTPVDGIMPLPGNHHLLIRAYNKLPESDGDTRYVHYWLTDGTPEGSVPLLNESGERFQLQLDNG